MTDVSSVQHAQQLLYMQRIYNDMPRTSMDLDQAKGSSTFVRLISINLVFCDLAVSFIKIITSDHFSKYVKFMF